MTTKEELSETVQSLKDIVTSHKTLLDSQIDPVKTKEYHEGYITGLERAIKVFVHRYGLR